MIPPSWLSRLHDPPAEDRPLQIVHGIDATGRVLRELGVRVPDGGPRAIVRRVMEVCRERGLGGVVCNVDFDHYLRSEAHWQTLLAGVEAARDLGLVVWIYDEAGYPSGAAGGLVLQDHPEYEARELVYDMARPDPFWVRPAYEHTHACNNYYAARRYINLLDDGAVRAFIERTHQAYSDRLGPHLGSTVQAFFTDEPSLIAVNLGQIPEPARSRVPVADAVDPDVPALPAVPWVHDLAERYRERYGEDLLSRRQSLFTGDAAADRTTRRRFWSLIADLVCERYFGALEEWCAAHGVASSGHTLWEESLLHHAALEGNGLQALGRMHIPGLDLLTSDPQAVLQMGWLTAALPASAALLSGRRRVMTEVSDFSQKMAGRGPASLVKLQATAAWQAAWGVTDFTLYYGLADRTAAEYQAYGDYVGHLNALLKAADWAPDVLLYYPVHDLWAEYRPAAKPLKLESQTPRAQAIVASFGRLGQALTRAQVPFVLVDHDLLAEAVVDASDRLGLRGRAFRALVLPQDVELPEEARRAVERWKNCGGLVLRDTAEQPLDCVALAAALQPPCRLDPACAHVVLGSFVRERRPVLLLVNVGEAGYRGRLTTPGPGPWWSVDPATGGVEEARGDGDGSITLPLEPGQAVGLVGGG
ncbi:MAG: hypothetical protein AB1505_25880 [Candidatus Latescibacterota bacterium]